MGMRLALFALLLAFWLLLSDQYSVLFVSMGVVSAALVTWLTVSFFQQALTPTHRPLKLLPLRLWRIAVYVAWLFSRTMVSSLEVAWVVLHPRVPIEPGFLRFRTGLRSPMARAVLANSITLVPGTLTVRAEGGHFLIHALWPAAAEDIHSGELQRRIAATFLEPPPEEEVEVEWEPAGGEE